MAYTKPEFEAKTTYASRPLSVRVRRTGSKNCAVAYVFGEGPFVEVRQPRVSDFPHLALESIYTRRGDYPAVDRAFDAYNKSIVKAKREMLNSVLPLLCDAPEELKITFSRKAGCSCGCSPGFLIKGLPARTDIWVELEKPAAPEPAVDTSWVDLVGASL